MRIGLSDCQFVQSIVSMTIMHSVNLASIDMNLLVVLDALLAEAHVGRAGKRVGLSQPAASHALARLRALLDDPLLVRTGSVMMLTPKAERLRVPLADTLQAARALLTEASFNARTSRQTFTFMMPDLVCDLLGPPLVARVAEEAPGIHLDFTPWRGPDLLSERDLRALDFLVTSLTRVFPGFEDEPLYQDSDVVVVRARHPALKQLSGKAGFRAQRHIAIVGMGELEDVSESWLRSVGLSGRSRSRFRPIFWQCASQPALTSSHLCRAGSPRRWQRTSTLRL